jgi:hypothetical protein
MKLKYCNSCHNWYPQTTEHFYKNGLHTDGTVELASKCILCTRAYAQQYSKQYYAKHKKEILAYMSRKRKILQKI